MYEVMWRWYLITFSRVDELLYFGLLDGPAPPLLLSDTRDLVVL